MIDLSNGLPGVCVSEPSNFDDDQDGWPSNAQTSFLQSLGHTVPPMDCDDSNAAIHQGLLKLWTAWTKTATATLTNPTLFAPPFMHPHI